MFLTPSLGVAGLVIGTVAGAAAHMAIRAQAMWRYGFRPQLKLELSPEIRETITLMLPKMIQIGMRQIMLWWFVRLASQVGEGSVTKYNFAYNFQSVPVSLIGIAIALASFSQLSHLAAQRDFKRFRDVVKLESIKIVVITALAAVALAIISRPLIWVLLGGGAFDHVAVNMTATLLQVYAFSIPLESLMHLLSRAHYAARDTLRLSLIHIFAILCSMGASWALLPVVGLFALPIAFSVGFGIQSVLLGFSLIQLIKQKARA